VPKLLQHLPEGTLDVERQLDLERVTATGVRECANETRPGDAAPVVLIEGANVAAKNRTVRRPDGGVSITKRR
jgi:hypothetical protein